MRFSSTTRAVAITGVAALAVLATASGCGTASAAVSQKNAASTPAATSGASKAKQDITTGTIVAFGGSATYGWGSGSSGYSLADGGHDGDSYPAQLAALTGRTVVNEGVVGELVTKSSEYESVSGVARFEKYVAANPNIGAIVVWDGLNDVGTQSAAQVESAYAKMIAAAKASGVPLFLCTQQPNDWEAGSAKEDTREAVNNWIRKNHGQYAVIDLEQVLKGGSDLYMNPLFIATANASHPHAGYPHLSAAGYGAVADAVAEALNHPEQTAAQVTYPAG